MERLSVGDSAPDLTFATSKGENISLTDFRGKQTVVLFFYPRAGTPVCTKEACSFRDAYESFTEAGAVVIGVSGDKEKRRDAFGAKHEIPFLLASDVGGSIRQAFGVPKTWGVAPGRVTYVIDREGVIRLRFQDAMNASHHVEEALAMVRNLKEADKEEAL
jgi:thioredoxin-dependent peroxiredoxin